jgi:hypothetical protein
VAGQASGGQTLTPNSNVSAPAGIGGELWGRFGGGIAAIGTAKPVAATVSDGETAANYVVDAVPNSVQGAEAVGALDKQTLDTALPVSGTNLG